MKYAYKGVAAILALVVIVIAICTPLFSISINTPIGTLLNTVGPLLNNETISELLDEYNGKVPNEITMDFTVSDLIEPSENSIVSIANKLGSGEGISEETLETLKPAFPYAIVFLVVFALVLICALAAAITAIVCKNNRKVIYLCTIGCGLNFLMFKTFKDLARIFIDGDISLADLAGSEWVSLIGSISELEMSTTMWFITVIFVAVIIWTVLYNFTLPKKEKLERKRMLGELD